MPESKMKRSFWSVLIYCAMLLPMCMRVYTCGISARYGINRALIPTLTIIGVLPAIQTIMKMRGLSISIVGIRTTTIRTITIMFGALEQESEFVGCSLGLHRQMM